MSSIQVDSVRDAPGGRRVRPSTPEDGPAIVALMRQAGLQPHTEPEHLDWKYWRPRPDWQGSRSFVITEGRELLAHGAVVPGTMHWGTRQGRVIHMIDWARAARPPGRRAPDEASRAPERFPARQSAAA
ncbi:hypothetical protein B1A_16844, partial [mine drainage metagenome]